MKKYSPDIACDSIEPGRMGQALADDAGILAGQCMPYLQTQFEDFKAGKRSMPQRMKPKIDKLDKAAIDELVNFYGSFK